MQFLTRFEQAQKLWALVVPSVPAPPDSTFVGWLARNTDKEFEIALLRIPHRIRNWEVKRGAVDAVEIYKLVTTQLNDLRKHRNRRAISSHAPAGRNASTKNRSRKVEQEGVAL
jgi:hypothetical protein